MAEIFGDANPANLNDNLVGTDGSDSLYGGAGNDRLDGKAGGDAMVGGSGNDIFTVDDILDLALEAENEGLDTVYSLMPMYYLTGNVENLILKEPVAGSGLTSMGGGGNELNNGITGNSLNNDLFGAGGNDTLDGKAGDDNLSGDDGNDRLLGGEGNDFLDGGAGNDTLDGGAGEDILRGGAGNDTYFLRLNWVAPANPEYPGYALSPDMIDELPDSGIDTVISYYQYNYLFNLANIENLVLGEPPAVAPGEPSSGDYGVGYGNDANNTITGNSRDNYLAGYGGNDTLYGGDGSDTLHGDDPYENIEGGVGNDRLYGGAGHDKLVGGWGNDTLDGGTGADEMIGGAGNDTYTVDVKVGYDYDNNSYSIGDRVIETLAGQEGGIDTVRSSISYALGANLENLTLVDVAVPLDSWGMGPVMEGGGNELDNVIKGNNLDNYLFGEGGNDTLSGGAGNDTLYGDESYSMYMPAGVPGNDRLSGGAGNDRLYGGDGNDTLDGGTGSDEMDGGAGNDVYVVDAESGYDPFTDTYQGGDQIVESLAGAEGGVDTVRSSVNYALGANLENLTLVNVAEPLDPWGMGPMIMHGDGNELDNVITGNNLNNFLGGFGGNDNLSGGAGNDTLYGDDPYDMYMSAIVAGNDRLSGGAGNDRLYGGDGNDTLDGGTGSDEMDGGAGNDTYTVDALPGYDPATDIYHYGDQVVEGIAGAEGGLDTVRSSVSFYLGANLENLILVETAAPPQDPWGMGPVMEGGGNELNNVITGNSWNNNLYGEGGNDTLSGGAGDDTLHGDDHYNMYMAVGVAGNDRLSGGAGNDYLYGGGGNDTLDGGTGSDSMEGGAGNDTYTVDTLWSYDPATGIYQNGDQVVESLAGPEGGIDTVRSSVSFYLGANLENLILVETAAPPQDPMSMGPMLMEGSGNELDNVITGNSLDNHLSGFAGNDTLSGGAGNDALYGDDSYNVYGGVAGNDRLSGGAGDDELYGGDGNDTLDGGTGVDLMIGGAGNDTYTVDATLDAFGFAQVDTVVEDYSPGIDTVRTGLLAYELGDWVENLLLLETGTAPAGYGYDEFGNFSRQLGLGNWLDNTLTGTSLGNELAGYSGNDVLYGNGGDDILDGGDGTDRLYAGDGDDTLWGGTGNDSLYGGNGSDTLFGDFGPGGGNDYLDGGAGLDDLRGGTGNDTYVVDGTASGDIFIPYVVDSVTEYAGEGTDTVRASVSFHLGANLENLTLLEGAVANGDFSLGTVATGNELNNVLTGNSGDNELAGKEGNDILTGGAGIDLMIGGAGSDRVSGGSGDDVYHFQRGDGADTLVETSGSDFLYFTNEVNYDQLWFSQSGNHLVVAVIGTTDKITVSNWYAAPAVPGNDNRVETIRAGEFVLAESQVQNLVSAMAGMTPPPAGSLTLDPARQTALADVLAASWSNTFV